MSIQIECPSCNKQIKAPHDAAGKRGKCPFCKKDVYIPHPPEEIEEIPLAPVDEEDEQHAEELRRESIEYAANLNRDQGGKYATGGAAGGKTPDASAGESVDVPKEVKLYVEAMRDSKLDKAEQVVVRLQKAGKRARDYVQGLLVDQMPPKIENVPEPVMKGFLKSLADRLK